MRKIIAGVFQSLDGVKQAPGGPSEDPTGAFTLGGWSFTFWDEVMGDYMDGVIGGDFDLLLGRKTYEIFAAHWPFMTDDPIGEKFDKIAKYVVTSSTEPLTWNNSHAINGDAAAGIARLKASDGPDLLIQGSSKLYPALIEAGLIDQLFLMTFPVVLGGGKRVFENGVKAGALKLVDHRVSTTGVIIATYEPAGPVPTGSFAMPEPNELERARQERMKREG
ncbi:dihydrofolate reductase [Sphingomonas sp. So64.6b]|uniref:dihydrofolate reductase family protein n=1 Tax=Sphingomonas sp. So64.6b TaxID=2997354 RepID=UPI00160439C9|nr:dihydrofolate reductase family protein [Sphingomonas sp. So64.6b]QNA86259.1 dihydrofolate reductase [Sphingomonas sp. So64.6b]